MKASDEAKPQSSNSDVLREEIIIVGAGQAGLSMGYWLKRKPRSFLLLEAGQRLGESWRQRYDSLVLFTPRRYSALPGLAFPGDPEGRPTKDEMAGYLQTYATTLRFLSRRTRRSSVCSGMERRSCCKPLTAPIKQRPSS
jgi:cation diffusion facilitator CzcD-associated flavoprotein CzcO